MAKLIQETNEHFREGNTRKYSEFYTKIKSNLSNLDCYFWIDFRFKPTLKLGDDKNSISGSFKRIESDFVWLNLDGQHGTYLLDGIKNANCILYEDDDYLYGFKIWTSDWTAVFVCE